MGTSNAIREAKKRQHAQEQIDANLALSAESKEMFGLEMMSTPLILMDTYSTKFMSVGDQIVLAVDKVDAPEVKAGMIPTKTDMSGYLYTRNHEDADDKGKTSKKSGNDRALGKKKDTIDAGGDIGQLLDMTENQILYDYSTTLSLNDGDLGAFKTLSAKISADKFRHYYFKDVTDENISKEGDFVLAYLRKTSEDGIGFTFDLYDGGEMSGEEDIPSVSATISLTKKGNKKGDIVWDYIITMHSPENKKPKDATIKSEYLKLQEFMRPIIVSMGILPSNL